MLDVKFVTEHGTRNTHGQPPVLFRILIFKMITIGKPPPANLLCLVSKYVPVLNLGIGTNLSRFSLFISY